MNPYTYYGACGVEYCLDCRPIFDVDNEPILGTGTIGTNASILQIVNRHINTKFTIKGEK